MILERMNRKYTARNFAELVESIYQTTPLAAIGVDILSGFPGEDHAAHRNTYSLIQDLPVSYLHVFPFSPRTGTAASTFDGQVAPNEIKKRAAEIRDLDQRKRLLFYHGCLEKNFLVLAEKWHSEEKGMIKGMSDNFLPVLFPSTQDFQNQLVTVRMKRVEKNRVIGTML